MESMILSFVEYLKQFGYIGVIIALTFEFVPAELVLPLAGYWVYEGDLNFWGTVIAGTVGGTLGPLTLYAVGRYGGRPFLLKYGKYVFIREKEIKAADDFFEKYGAGVAFFGRFLPGVRTTISVPCGMAKMNVWVFSIYTFIAMFPITAFYVYLGEKFGPKWKEAGPMVKEYMGPIALVIVAALIVLVLIKYNKHRKLKNS
ncbi:DedA family protein [Fictibacillus iocasae]|uniref:DedA family protein n=1 Tax=Fictibacillus iocasae TaxID=2715437 RepID=A0ABW2NUP4_9BACL